jgi:hypothetical protein
VAVTSAPTNVSTSIAAYRTANPSLQLTHVGLVSTPPGSLATASLTAGGFFDVWYDLTNNKLLIDTTLTQG